jgi:hypothetical protein
MLISFMIEQFENKSQILTAIERLEKNEYNELNTNLDDMKTEGEILALEEQILKLQRTLGEKEAQMLNE